MIDFDVIILDVTCKDPYDTLSLGDQPLGGTEATVLRLCDGLAAKGYKVGVIQHNLGEVLIGRHDVFFLPFSYMDEVNPQVFISLRGVACMDRFPNAKKISFQHDDPTEAVKNWPHKDITFVCVSDWHKDKLQALLPDAKVMRIYNPVPDNLFETQAVKVDKHKMAWTASPHKGLPQALEDFKEIRKQIPSMRLHVFNPGYFPTKTYNVEGVVWEGPQPSVSGVWKCVRSSLCTFYPTDFAETFGLIAAESNCLRTPIATMPIAALNESVSSKNQLFNSRKDLIDGVVKWYHGERPTVEGQERFKASEVLQQWISLINHLTTS